MEKRSSNKTLLGIIAIILVMFIALLFLASKTIQKIGMAEDFGGKISGKSVIGVIEIDNVIMDSKVIIEKLQIAEENTRVKGIILRIDSPGGAVAPTQEIYHEVRRIAAKKPVYASFGTVAASGGYYIGAATQKIFASEGTLTGSIGVIMHFANLSKLYDLVKLSPYNIKAGKYKDIGSPNRDMTDEEKGLLEGMVNETHQQFIRDILSVRQDRISKDQLLQAAQGQIVNGEVAKQLGLIDEIGGLWVAARAMHKSLAISEKLELHYIKTDKEQSVWRFLDRLDEASSFIEQLNVAKTTAPMFIYQP